MKIEEYKDHIKGSSCWILGNGPSLVDCKLDQIKLPSIGGSSPEIVFSKVDFPCPFLPKSPIILLFPETPCIHQGSGGQKQQFRCRASIRKGRQIRFPPGRSGLYKPGSE